MNEFLESVQFSRVDIPGGEMIYLPPMAMGSLSQERNITFSLVGGGGGGGFGGLCGIGFPGDPGESWIITVPLLDDTHIILRPGKGGKSGYYINRDVSNAYRPTQGPCQLFSKGGENGEKSCVTFLPSGRTIYANGGIGGPITERKYTSKEEVPEMYFRLCEPTDGADGKILIL